MWSIEGEVLGVRLWRVRNYSNFICVFYVRFEGKACIRRLFFYVIIEGSVIFF